MRQSYVTNFLGFTGNHKGHLTIVEYSQTLGIHRMGAQIITARQKGNIAQTQAETIKIYFFQQLIINWYKRGTQNFSFFCSVRTGLVAVCFMYYM